MKDRICTEHVSLYLEIFPMAKIITFWRHNILFPNVHWCHYVCLMAPRDVWTVDTPPLLAGRVQFIHFQCLSSAPGGCGEPGDPDSGRPHSLTPGLSPVLYEDESSLSSPHEDPQLDTASVLWEWIFFRGKRRFDPINRWQFARKNHLNCQFYQLN